MITKAGLDAPIASGHLLLFPIGGKIGKQRKKNHKNMNPKRPDDTLAIELHKDRFYGGTALIVLGGPSGKDWERLRDEIKPDVVNPAE